MGLSILPIPRIIVIARPHYYQSSIYFNKSGLAIWKWYRIATRLDNLQL